MGCEGNEYATKEEVVVVVVIVRQHLCSSSVNRAHCKEGQCSLLFYQRSSPLHQSCKKRDSQSDIGLRLAPSTQNPVASTGVILFSFCDSSQCYVADNDLIDVFSDLHLHVHLPAGQLQLVPQEQEQPGAMAEYQSRSPQ